MCQLSIVIPVYQAEKCIADAIESVVNVVQEEIEILLINDGSTDGSLQICREYEQKYEFINLFSQENKGVSSARNLGIEKATGKYILFLDSDDKMSKDSLPFILKILKKHHDIAIFIFGFRYIYSDTTVEQLINLESGVYELDEMKACFYDWYDSRILHNIGTKIYLKELLDRNEIRFSEDKNYLEDLTFCLDCLRCVNGFYYIKHAYYQYRMGNDQSLSSGYKNYYMDSFKFMLKSLERLLGHDSQTEEIYGKIILSGFVDIFVHEILYKKENMALFQEISSNKEYFLLYKKYRWTLGFKYCCILKIIFMRCQSLRRKIVRGLICRYAKR